MSIALSPEELAVCQAALDEACKEIGSPSEFVRSEMATRIMARQERATVI